MSKFKFAEYYDITETAQKHSENYNTYAKVFICVDTHVYWIARVLEGYENDDDAGYVANSSSAILERNNIPKKSKGAGIESHAQLLSILDEDDFSNWDCINCDNVEDAVDNLDDGFGLGVYDEKTFWN